MRTPVSTYRLQITEDFDLLEAARRAALPARPRRRLGLPLAAARRGAGQQPRVRRGPTTPRSTRRAAGPRAWRRCRPRPAGSAWACWSTSCPTTSASPRRDENAWWWDVLDARPGLASTPTRSTSTGPPAAAGCGSRWSATTTSATTVDRQPRGRGRASCATTTTASRWPPARRRRTTGLTPRTCTPGSTTSWSTGGRPTPTSTTAGSSRSTRLAAIRVEDPEVFDRSHVEIRRWFDEGLVDGLRVDHPDGLRDPRATSTTSPS